MLRFQTLGALDLRRADGTALHTALAQPKRLALLAYLALATPRGFHRRDTLLALFWPESDDARARAALRQALRYLRRALGEDAIASRSEEEVAMAPGALWCDAVAFEELLDGGRREEALALYRGHLLEGLFVSDASPDLERWIAAQRERLRSRATAAAWSLAESAEAEGSLDGAARWARLAVSWEPDNEESLRRLMALLDRSGDPAGALRAYDELVRRLAEDYEMRPSPETVALAEAVRARATPRRAWADGAPDAAPAAPTPPPPAPARVPRRRPRPALLAALLAVAAAAAGLAAASFRPSALERPVARRVAVAPFENRTGDPSLGSLGQMAADWITQGLAETRLVDVVDPSTATTVVRGAFYRDGDTVRIQARITDARDGRVLRTIGPLGAPTLAPTAAVEELRRRVTASLAALLDPKLSSWANAASQPPSYEAYREHADGMELFIARRHREAVDHFRRAAALDSDFATPRLMAGVAYINLRSCGAADSAVAALVARRERLAPIDRGLLDWVRAECRGDWAAALDAARRNAALTPGSSFHYVVAWDALRLRRPRQAVATLEALDPREGFLRGWVNYWSVLTAAHHVLGDHRRELAAARAGRAQHPTTILMRRAEVRALAALGRVEEVRERIDESLALPRPDASPALVMEEAALELRAHGHDAAARAVLARAIAWHRSRPPEEQATDESRAPLARALYLAGDWAAARRILVELARRDTTGVSHLGALGAAAARLGDHAEAQRIARRLEGVRRAYLFGEPQLWRARIAAIEGNGPRAVQLLRDAFAEGLPYDVGLHRDPDLARLAGERELRELLRPEG